MLLDNIGIMSIARLQKSCYRNYVMYQIISIHISDYRNHMNYQIIEMI